MLVLKVNRKQRVKLFYEGHEIGEVFYDRPDATNPLAIRLVFDFDDKVKIYRDKVIERSDELRADLKFRGE